MPDDVSVDLDVAIYSLSALNAAAYRISQNATCQIEKIDTRYNCRLSPIGNSQPNELKAQFLQLVADETVRENLRAKTEPVRNLVLSLAFGALAHDSGGGE